MWMPHFVIITITPHCHHINYNDNNYNNQIIIIISIMIMTSMPRWIALIINNKVFSPSTEIKDCKILRDRSRSKNDIEALKMWSHHWEEFEEGENFKCFRWGSKWWPYWSEYDCFVLCLMSHGKEELFYGSDGQTVLFETVCDLFSSSSGRTLRGEPKQ